MIFLNWSGEGTLGRPSEFEPHPHSADFYIKMPTKNTKTSRDSENCEVSVFSHVVRLVHLRFPLAVLWAVMSVNIFTLQCFPFWSHAHIVEKIDKLSPSFADGNPPASIILPLSVFWVGCPSYHTGPAFVGSGLEAIDTMAVLNVNLSRFGSDCITFGRHSIGHSMLCLAAGVRRQPALAANLTDAH